MPQQLDRISESDTSGSDSDLSLLHLEKSAWVDIGSGHFTVLRWTPGFASILRRPSQECAGFLNWLAEEQRQGFVAWLREPAAERVRNQRTVTLRLPRQGGGARARGKSFKRNFLCTVFESAEELPDTPNLSEVRVVRLDLLERRSSKQDNKLWQTPTSHCSSTVLLWVEMPSKLILKSENAPRETFQSGTCLNVAEEHLRFFRLITLEMMVNMNEVTDPCVLGMYTLTTSSGYQLHAKVSLLKTGDDWEGTGRSWCLLCLSKVRLLEIKAEVSAQL